MTPVFRLTILGTPGIAGPGGRVAGAAGQGQPLALLAVLACAGERGISRDRVTALFWPDASGQQASHRLSQLTHSIRRSLGCSDLMTGASDLSLRPDRIGCDLWELTAARGRGDFELAASLYAGPLLDGFFLPESLEFDRWLEPAALHSHENTVKPSRPSRSRLSSQETHGPRRTGGAGWPGTSP